ncbi:MAG: type II toxin-antitoxin system RelE/ParE family toxin [Nanoarchaeota archaeon]|nr:type II toxin-antitoxin system RelE/ParE family toxin [Nanoarchaeota archaeon]
MLDINHSPEFLKKIEKIKNNALKEKIKKQIAKIIEFPEIGKPMRYSRKGTRELHIRPFRISYAYLKGNNKIVFLDLYHKDEQ